MDISPVILIQVLRHQIRGGGGGSRPSMILMTQGEWGVQHLGKPDDVILERSLMVVLLLGLWLLLGCDNNYSCGCFVVGVVVVIGL